MSAAVPFHPDDNGVGAHGIFGLPYTLDDARLVVALAPWEVTVTGRRGTAHAPQHIINASADIDLYFHPHGTPWQAGVAAEPFPEKDYETNLRLRTIVEEIYLQIREGADPSTIDTTRWVDEENTRYLRRLEERIARYIERGQTVGLVGGEHTVALAGMRAALQRYPQLGILQVDAHADLRPHYLGLRTSHASVFRRLLEDFPQTPLVQVGLRDVSVGEKQFIDQHPHIHAHFAADLYRSSPDRLLQTIDPLPQHVYISFDIDGLDLQYCPHTGTPVPGGLSFQEAFEIISRLVQSGRTIVGFDLCEVGEAPLDVRVGVFALFHLVNYTLLSNQAS